MKDKNDDAAREMFVQATSENDACMIDAMLEYHKYCCDNNLYNKTTRGLMLIWSQMFVDNGFKNQRKRSK